MFDSKTFLLRTLQKRAVMRLNKIATTSTYTSVSPSLCDVNLKAGFTVTQPSIRAWSAGVLTG